MGTQSKRAHLSTEIIIAAGLLKVKNSHISLANSANLFYSKTVVSFLHKYVKDRDDQHFQDSSAHLTFTPYKAHSVVQRISPYTSQSNICRSWADISVKPSNSTFSLTSKSIILMLHAKVHIPLNLKLKKLIALKDRRCVNNCIRIEVA
jgi:hypothetical protein